MEQRNRRNPQTGAAWFAKRFISEKLLNSFLDYLSKNPEKHITKVLSLLERMSLDRGVLTKENMRKLQAMYEGDPAVRKYIDRLLTELSPDVLKKMTYNVLVNHAIAGIKQQVSMRDELGVNVPSTILIDPTSACDLNCTGCWARESGKKADVLEPELFERILKEANELGIYLIVVSGGEPFLYPHLIETAKKHPDMTFMVYTNGTRIDDRTADQLLEAKNIAPCFSLEGGKERTDARRGEGIFDKVTAAMDRLRERGVMFGVSLTITKENIYEITSDEFMDFLIDKGGLFGWTFHYIPVGSGANHELMITAEQRAYLKERVPEIRNTKAIKIADFWNDGELTQGCIAGGREYFHINARGDVKPCAFVHFSMDNIREKSLVEVLGSPLFRAYQKRQPFCSNHLKPCPIIDNPQLLRDIVKESGAQPTYDGADAVLSGEIGGFLDQRSREWDEAVSSMEHNGYAEID